MPIYEYQCTDCGHTLEKLQKINDDPLKLCPACQKQTLQKLVSAAGFQLKGTGWYVTDFRDNNKPKPTTETKTDGTEKSAVATESKSESATKAETKAEPAAASTPTGEK